MKIESFNDWWIFNGTLELLPNEMHGQELEGPVIYEVIRVKQGRPVFLKAHFERLERSLKLLLGDRPVPVWVSSLSEDFIKLMKAEDIVNQNIKIIIWNIGLPTCSWCMFLIKSQYPARKVYQRGVDTDILSIERTNPSAKLYHDTLVKTVNAMREETGVFEVLLSDRTNCLTEGSRSNLFFVKNGNVYTAPEGDILHGITREKLKTVLKQEHIKCIEEPLDVESIASYDGAFLTGTSIHVLPIRSIGTLEFNSSENETILKIMEAFETSIEKDDQNV